MKQRILLITQWFDPEPTFKGLLFATELVKKGFDVEVITGFPNYPGGKVYPGYKIQLYQSEVLQGVKISRLPLYPSHNNSKVKRILNYLSFAFSALIYGFFASKRADIIYAYHPPLSVGIVAILLRAVRKVPVVLDIQDMWPDSLRATGMIRKAWMLKFIAYICLRVYNRCDKIVVLSPGFKRLLTKRKVPSNKIEIIYNWANEKSLLSPSGELPKSFPDNEFFKVVFAGNIGKAQSVDTILSAARLIKNNDSKVKIIILGSGIEAERLSKKSKKMDLHNVIFIDSVPMTEVGTYLKAADVLLVNLKKDPLFKITVPSKTQAYMAVGKPILMAVEGEARKLVVKAKCGLTSLPENEIDLAETILEFSNMDQIQLQNLANNSKDFYNKNLSLKVGIEKFSQLFSEVVSPNV